MGGSFNTSKDDKHRGINSRGPLDPRPWGKSPPAPPPFGGLVRNDTVFAVRNANPGYFPKVSLEVIA